MNPSTATAVDALLSLAVVFGSVLYYTIPVLRRWLRNWCRLKLANRRSFLLVFEYARLFLTFWGVLGTTLAAYPRLLASWKARGVDVLAAAERAGCRLDPQTFEDVRLGLLGLAGTCLALGLLCRLWTRRDAFRTVAEALEYAVRDSPRPLDGACYAAHHRGQTSFVVAVRDPGRRERWEATARAYHEWVESLDGLFRSTGQGANVRVVCGAGAGRHVHWSLGRHAYIVADAPADVEEFDAEDREVEALTAGVLAMVSAYGE